MVWKQEERIVILGATGGLGEALTKHILIRDSKCALLLCGRREAALENLRAQAANVSNLNQSIETYRFDAAHASDELYVSITEFRPTRILCLVGGGPFGRFTSKEWKDHLWAFKVSFEFQAQLLHWALQGKSKSLAQVMLTGSKIAESSPDPNAASYAASKHALKGLIDSVVKEVHSLDLRLLSPGYLNTRMLPPNAWPRQQEGLVLEPDQVVEKIQIWLESSSMGHHLVL